MNIEDFLPELNKNAMRYYERVQQRVKYCVTCQPYDGGDYVWIMGIQTTLEELFDDINCPEKYRDAIADHISCPYCGNSSFERYDIVGEGETNDLSIESHLKKAEQRYGKKIVDFQSYLEQYPSLALDHPMGRKLHKEIQRNNAPTTLATGEWYRARPVNGSKVFENDDMRAPNVGISGGGRYHHAGQRVLYIANEESTAIKEVLSDHSEPSLIWVQKYKIIEPIEKILDLTPDWDNFSPSFDVAIVALLSTGTLMQPIIDRKNKWTPQYFITRFIADCARKAGYQGILYRSTKEYSNNLVLFDPDLSQVICEGNPRVIIFDHKERDIFVNHLPF